MTIQNVEDILRIKNDPARHLKLPLTPKVKIVTEYFEMTTTQAKRIRKDINNFLKSEEYTN